LLKSANAFEELVKSYRDCSVNTTIILSTFEEFRLFWISLKDKEELSEGLFGIWRAVPHQHLK
jgi:hypothetical protein